MIRMIEPGDVPAVLELIRELAAYELAPDAVGSTADDLHAAFFGEGAQAYATVAVEDDRVVGVAVWTVSFSTWTGRYGISLDDLVVTAGARQGGHGAALLGELARICAARGYRRIDWNVLNALEDAPDGRPGPHGFYRRQGGHPRTEWTSWRLDGDALGALAARAAHSGGD